MHNRTGTAPHRICLIVSVCLLACSSMAFGASADHPAASPATRPAATQPHDSSALPDLGPLAPVVQLWTGGQQQQAVDAFLAIDWSAAEFPPDSIFGRKEKDIPSLSPVGRERVVKVGLEVSTLVRQIGKQVLAQADQFAFEKKVEQAERRYIAVEQCGKAISPAEGLAILRMTGISMQTQALQKRISLYETMGQADKAAACRQALKDVEAQATRIREIARKMPGEPRMTK